MYCLFFALYSILTLPMKNAIKDIYDGQMQAFLLVTIKLLIAINLVDYMNTFLKLQEKLFLRVEKQAIKYFF